MYLCYSARFLFTILSLSLCHWVSAQSLSIGELAFTGYNADADPNNTSIGDDFSFVLLAAVESGQTLSFTDRGWLAAGGFRTGEGTLTLTFDAAYACAAEFRVYEEDNVWKVNELSINGSPTITETGDFSLSSSGDQILVYNGTIEPTMGNEEAFVAALQFAGAWQSEASGTVESAQPAIFASNIGTDFVIDPHFDNGKYDCLINAGAPAAIRGNIYDLSNWGFDNSSTNRFDLSSACNFFCQGTCTAATITGISTNSSDNTFCQGDEITFNIEGSLNDASLWSLYNGSCNGEQLTTSSSNTIKWIATKSGTFYIGGFGGCVTNPSCLALEIVVNGTAANAGPDQRLAGGISTTILQGNTPTGGSGTWSFVDEGDGNGLIAEPNNPSSSFSGTSGQSYELAWTISTPECPEENTDAVLISFLNPTTLQLGDLAFTAYNSDDDDFAFAILTDIDAGTSISFTERGWQAAGGFRPGENTFTLEFSRAYDCGTEFIVYDLPTLVVLDPADVPAGNITSGAFLALSTTGDQIFAFQGDDPTAADQSGFLAAIQMNGDWDEDATNSNESALPSLFTNGENAIAIIPEAQNAKYSCSTTSAAEGELANILNTASLWDASNAPFTLNSTTLCELDCQDCSLPILESVDLPAIDPCPGETITININGSLEGAAEWVISANSCHGTALAVGTSNMLSFIPPLDGKFWVGAQGGCVLDRECIELSINIGGILADAGPDQKIEGSTTVTLAANGAYGSGTWSFTNAGDDLGMIADVQDPASGFQGTMGQAYRLQWSLQETSDCGASTDEMEIAFLGPSTSLELGDLVFVTYSADSDDFSFVLLKDIMAGTQLNFTDRGWMPTGGFRPGEGDIQISFCRPYDCGTQFNVFDATQEVKDVDGKIAGTIMGTPLDLSTSGDQIFAYQGLEPSNTDESTFVAAIQMNGGWDSGTIGTVESNKPSVFTDGINSISISPQIDNAYYACTEPGPAEASETRTLVNNADNWIGDDSNSPELPLDCVLRCCSEYTVGAVSVSKEGPYCVGDLITLGINGQLNGAADWVWYGDGCGVGDPIGMGESLSYKVGTQTSLYVRGENGCDDIGEECFVLELMIEEMAPIAICQDISINLGDTFTPADLDGGSSDNCPDFVFSVAIEALDCKALGDNTVLLFIEDSAGQRDSCEAIITVIGEDEDCDGVADECDECPSGDDKVDNNGNNIPDCTEALAVDQIIEAWRCGPQLDSVFVCRITNGDPSSAQTECRSPSEVADVLNTGGYLGPCGNTPCGNITSSASITERIGLRIFPNPARDQVRIEIPNISLGRSALYLYNSFGQLIYQSPIAQQRQGAISWELADLPAGIYFISLENQQGSLRIQKLIVLK
ncbi:MAG: T9SS type A sorting domain-containing protein [Saprospiraceae bacterium]|nr:T9SS type A sorting domain-containing protein [Saprospiraceae bacterium]